MKECLPGARLANKQEVEQLYDETFFRMWDFYLCATQVAFRNQDLMVFQLQLAKKVDSLPVIRDYMIDWERGQPTFDETAVEDGRQLDKDRKTFWPERKRATG